jgi:hypothetical protein
LQGWLLGLGESLHPQVAQVWCGRLACRYEFSDPLRAFVCFAFLRRKT